MSKKTLSDLIMNFKGGIVKKNYEPANSLIKPMGKSVKKTKIADTQKKIDYKKEYEQLQYKKMYEEMRPHPKALHKEKDFFEQLQVYKDYGYNPNDYDYGDVDELLNESKAPSGFTSIPDVVSGYNPYYPNVEYSGVRPEQATRAASRAASRVSSRMSSKAPSEFSYASIRSAQPFNLSEIPQEYIGFKAQEHDNDDMELMSEYVDNPSNFQVLGRPKKQFLKSDLGEEVEVSLFNYNEPFSEVVETAIKYERGKNPASAVGRKKGPEARKAKAAAKKAEDAARQSGLIYGNGIMHGAKKKLKRNSLLGGKISVGNLNKFFKSSYSGKKAPKKIDTYNLDESITNKYGTVYFDPEKNHAVITHKGTSGDTLGETVKDWGNNAAYAMGLYKYTDRYKQGKKLQEQTEQKYGSQNVSTLGHSQGSKLSRDLGQKSKEIINLNPAYKGEKPLKNEYNIRSSGDVVSAGLHGTNRGHDTLIPAASLNPLKEHAIDILDRIDQDKMIGGKKRTYKKKGKIIYQ